MMLRSDQLEAPPVETPAQVLHADALVWDQHGCLPLTPDGSAIDSLELYAESGVDFVSINVGMDATPPLQTLRVISAFRHAVRQRDDRYVLARSAQDVVLAKETGRLAVGFDLEGTEPLDGSLDMIETYYDLGVRTMLIAYNEPNRAGGGCHGNPDVGLTQFGKAVVREMNRVGMVVDATHCSRRTTFDLFELSSSPVVFSHSVPATVKEHPRNIDDAQMLACAETGGVIGINGVGIFLGDNDATTRSLVRAIDHAVELVGSQHVGLGLDFVFDRTELTAFVNGSSNTFPAGYGYIEYGSLEFASPAQLPEVTGALIDRGYSTSDVRNILGGSFLRVANQVWR
jgi:membrane dipeptidase